jgi:hypothetical protein
MVMPRQYHRQQRLKKAARKSGCEVKDEESLAPERFLYWTSKKPKPEAIEKHVPRHRAGMKKLKCNNLPDLAMPQTFNR